MTNDKHVTNDEREVDQSNLATSKYFDPYPCDKPEHPFEDLVQEGLTKESTSMMSVSYRACP